MLELNTQILLIWKICVTMLTYFEPKVQNKMTQEHVQSFISNFIT